jgi:hypothetical protein
MRTLVLVAVVAGVAGCASTPPAPPLTVEQKIDKAVHSTALVGGDYMQTYIDLYTIACTNGTVTDMTKCDEVAALRAERAKQQVNISVRSQ